MPADWSFAYAVWPAAQSLLLVATRVGAAVSFIPIPGFRAVPVVVRVLLTVAVSLMLGPAWTAVPGEMSSGLSFLRCIAGEAAFGIAAGVVAAWLNEAFVIGMQIVGLQAGYSYTSTIDPTTQADSGILPVLAQLITMMLFFAAGLDRAILQAFAGSLQAIPPGSFRIDGAAAEAVLKYTGAMLSLAMRLALPLVALLVLVDLALALLGRLNAHLQLLTLAFPAKMLLSLVVLASLTTVLPALYRQSAEGAVRLLWRLAAPGIP